MNIGPYDLDDTLLPAARDTGTPQLALYQYDRVAVVVGRGGDPQREVDLAAAARSGVPVLRRPGGGCAVVLDRGNLVVSLALPLPGLGAIRSAFNAISDWMIAGLSACGVSPVTQRGISDLAVADRKLGGSCIYRTRGLLYYSSTLLVAPDLTLIDQFLPHPVREPDYRRGRSHRDFLTSLVEMGIANDPQEFRSGLEPALRQELTALWTTCRGFIPTETA